MIVDTHRPNYMQIKIIKAKTDQELLGILNLQRSNLRQNLTEEEIAQLGLAWLKKLSS